MFKRNIIRVAIGMLAAVLLLSGWQLVRLVRFSEATEADLAEGRWDEATKGYLRLVESNKASFGLPAFYLDNGLEKVGATAGVKGAGKYYVLGGIALANERLEQANGYFKEVAKANPGPSEIPLREFYSSLSQVALGLSNWGELANNSQMGLEAFPQDLDLTVQRGIGCVKLFRYSDGYESFRKALQIGNRDIEDKIPPGIPKRRLIRVGEVLPRSLTRYGDHLFLYELMRTLREGGFEVLYPSERIGTTGFVTPATIHVQSAGYGYGVAWIMVNGHDLAAEVGVGRGYNLAVLDPQTAEVKKMGKFDVSDVNPAEGRQMLAFVDSAPEGSIVIATVHDNASNVPQDGVRALRKIGSVKDIRGKGRWGHIVIGVKGAEPGRAVELTGQGRIDAYVMKGNLNVPSSQVIEEMEKLRSKTGRNVVYITGLKPDDEIAWIPAAG